jgi:hypothetical protein
LSVNQKLVLVFYLFKTLEENPNYRTQVTIQAGSYGLVQSSFGCLKHAFFQCFLRKFTLLLLREPLVLERHLLGRLGTEVDGLAARDLPVFEHLNLN